MLLGGRWSVVVSGLYSDFSYKEKERDRWSLSEFSVEPRIWPLIGGGYRWLNLGLFGEYGDFDVRGGLIAPGKEVLYGRTGCFWSAGASVGSLIPLAGRALRRSERACRLSVDIRRKEISLRSG